ncbi:hypothetical protein E4T52_00294 [Aureobasidium sp. EXF-3400]|nr:hypothetical protein E4T51_00984 [Aureobasidium sp. EXF-12344]KAI4784738.1 hypothetical protein E4T52_00294 [Aureobasidium sp. EXF-3400]
MSTKLLRAAACHVSPVFLSATKTTEKAINLIHQAHANEANLVVFPETYISAFPIWSAVRAPTENHHLFARMVKGSVFIDGPEISLLQTTAKKLAAHCFEAKCFGIINAAFLDPTTISIVSNGASNEASIRQTLQLSQRAATMFLDPTGTLKPGFTIDAEGRKQETEYLQDREDILYADLDVAECVEGKQYHDVVGGYQRLDVFDLRVDRTRREPARFVEEVWDEGVEG